MNPEDLHDKLDRSDTRQRVDTGAVLFTLVKKVIRNLPELLDLGRWRTLVEKTLNLALIAAQSYVKSIRPCETVNMGGDVLATSLTRSSAENPSPEVAGGLIRFPANTGFGIYVDWNNRVRLNQHASRIAGRLQESGKRLVALMDGPTFRTWSKDHLASENSPVAELMPDFAEDGDYAYASVPNNGLMVDERVLVPLEDKKDKAKNRQKAWIYSADDRFCILDITEKESVKGKMELGKAEGVLLGCAGMLDSNAGKAEISIIEARISEVFNRYSALMQVYRDQSMQEVVCSYYLSMHEVNLEQMHDYMQALSESECAGGYYRAALLEMYDHSAYVVDNTNNSGGDRWIGIQDPDDSHGLNVVIFAAQD